MTIKKLGVANSLTILRIICIPIFIIFYWADLYGFALFTFAFAGFTDLIDGTIARLRREKSELGAILDPMADKGLMLATFIALALTGVVPWWFLFIILARDIVVILGFLFIKFRNLKYKYTALLTSKIATLLEIITGVLALLYMTYQTLTIWVYPVGDLVYGSVLITSAMILIATIQYLKLGMSLLEKKSAKSTS